MTPVPPVPLRVVFADDDYLVREGTAALLAEVAELDLVACVADPTALLAAVDEHRPDAVLTDIRMPPTSTTEGIDAARAIRARHPATGVVVLSQHVEPEYAYDLLKDGAVGLGYLLKERVSRVDELVHALSEVARGGSVLDPLVVEGLLARGSGAGSSPLATLTGRERQVLEEMASGATNATIARRLYLSERAVEKNINVLFAKLGLSEETDGHRRVLAVLTFLGVTGSVPAR
jgi:DNA-binding NarL/FixJ family response regulator